MHEISDLLRKRNPNVRRFSLRSVQGFCQDHDLSPREICNSEFQNIVREAFKRYDIAKIFFGKLQLRDVFVNLTDQNQVIEH